MAAPEMTIVALGHPCEWMLALQRPVVWERWWYCLLQMMTFPLHWLQLQWRVILCYPVGATLRDCAPSLSRPAMMSGSIALPYGLRVAFPESYWLLVADLLPFPYCMPCQDSWSDQVVLNLP